MADVGRGLTSGRAHVGSRAALLALAVGAVAAAGCAPVPVDEPRSAVLALGEPMDGFPNWEERVVFVWSNRARADPAADMATCGTNCGEAACYGPVPPFVWDHNLSRAARFHSANLVLSGCGLQHDSPCAVRTNISTLYTPGACNGAPGCACTGAATCGSVGTAWNTRIGYFGTPSSGENIARGYSDPVMTFYQWLHERDTNPACGFRATNGHRANILGSSRAMGVGQSSTTWTQDLGSSGTPNRIVGGVHYPRTGTSLDFRANWYAAAAPRSAQVSVNGTCSPMAIERGTGTNGTYLVRATVPSGCVRYVFHFVDSAGADVFYPSTGAFTIGCPAEWDATRPATCGACTPSCAGRTCGDDGCGGSCGTCGSGRTCNASGACACISGTDCAGSCVDTMTDEANCGGCARPCAPASTCTAGTCVAPCTPMCAGRVCGADGCGGSCGSCAADRTCSGSGTCTCTAGMDCAGACVDTTADPRNCGTCGRVCGGGEVCTASVCTCVPSCAGRTCGDDGCGGTCGGCAADRVCASGACACSGSLVLCGGACVDTRNDEANCGMCGMACAATETCSASTCMTGTTCTPDCAGRACGDDGCTGSCGTCGAGASCGAGGTCLCSGGSSSCGTACVDLRTDRTHCGDCTTVCALLEACVAGLCVGPPDGGFPDTGAVDGGSRDGGMRSDAGSFDADGAEVGPPGALVGTCVCRAGGSARGGLDVHRALGLGMLVTVWLAARRRRR